MATLRKCYSLSIDFSRYGIDPVLTLGTYNFSFWFNGSTAYLHLSLDPLVIAEVRTDGSVTIWGESCSEDYASLLVRVLGLNEDLTEFFSIAVDDPLLRGFSSCCRGWRLRSSCLWWSVLVGICQQNASFRQGWGMLFKLVTNFGRYASLGGREVLLVPRPEDVVNREYLLKESRLGYRSSAVVNVAKAFIRGDLSDEMPLKLSPEKLEEVLTSVKGIGRYTARLAIALSSREYRYPPIDRWLRALAARAYGIDEVDVDEYWVRRWGRWSALAVIATTIALDAEPLRRALKRLEEGVLKPVVTDKPTPTNMWRFKEL